LTANLANDAMPDWSPNGKQVAFVSNSDLKNFGNWVMDYNGNNKRKLTPDEISALTPAWCSDNTIYFGFVDDNTGKTGIASIKPDGTGFTKIIEEPFSGVYTADPSCSPDSLELAYDSSISGNSEVYKIAIDGSNRRNLTNNPNEDAQPRWFRSSNNPNGRIYFITDRDTQGQPAELNLYSIYPDGGGLERLTDFPGVEVDLSLSPDLTRFVLAHYVGLTGDFHIYRMDLEGTGLVQLTTEGQNRSPAWRPW
jgi:TolB protein